MQLFHKHVCGGDNHGIDIYICVNYQHWVMSPPRRSTENHIHGKCGGVLFCVFFLGGGSKMRAGESVWEERGHCMPKQLPSSSRTLPILRVGEGERGVSGETDIRAAELSVF